MAALQKVVWHQPSFPYDAVTELKWKQVAEFPASAILVTLQQFARDCMSYSTKVNDVVLNGMFASRLDYQEFMHLLSLLPNLRRLAMVNVNMNCLQIPPETMFRLESLTLKGCTCSHVPQELLHCSFSLRSLNLSHNLLSNIPLVFAHRLTKLQDLDLSNNRFTEFPSSLAVLQELKSLNISSNQLKKLDSLPVLPKLISLDVSYNSKLTELPTQLLNFPALRNLQVTNLNLLKKPPYSLARNGLDQVLMYLRRSRGRSAWLPTTST